MAYATISNWTTTDWNDDLEAIAREKYVPLVLGVGATRIEMICTGDLSFSVVTEYPDEAAAHAAQARIAEIRKQATEELPMKWESVSGGAVFAGG